MTPRAGCYAMPSSSATHLFAPLLGELILTVNSSSSNLCIGKVDFHFAPGISKANRGTLESPAVEREEPPREVIQIGVPKHPW